jgi:predicted nuclease of restriction endonuclease-like (RecB) superfamily
MIARILCYHLEYDQGNSNLAIQLFLTMNFDELVQILAQTHRSLQQQSSQAINFSLVVRNWLFGYYIIEFEQQGEDRAQYGSRQLAKLAEKLQSTGVPSCSVSNLRNFRQFYQAYLEIHQTLSGESLDRLPLLALSQKFSLSWSHYQVLMSINNPDERSFYEIEAAANHWRVRELERQIASSLFERLALSSDKDEVKKLASQGQIIESPRDAIKDPYILEFLELEQRPSYSENDLETAIINKLEHFLLELGKGFLFEARQKRFSLDEEHFYVDLVFYNRLLRCYVLIDLKLDKLTHQDLGQMQMYVNYFDRYIKTPDENPTIGIVLCKRKKDALVELTLPKDANIFAAQYQLYLPSKEELQRQLEEAAREAESNDPK